MQLLKNSIEIIFSPVGVTTIFMASGVLLGLTHKRRQLSRRLLLSGGLLFLVLLFSPFSRCLMLELEKDYPPIQAPPASPQISRIVVLAGYAEQHAGFPITTELSEQTIGTVSEGLRLYRLMPGSTLILSGGVVRQGEKPVAAFMAEFLRQVGVPEKDIVVEGRSANTFENLAEVNRIIGSQPFLLVAQACDMRRAIAVARRLRMNPIAAPACHWSLQHHDMNAGVAKNPLRQATSFFYPSIENLARAQWAYHEYIGYLWYKLLDRI